MLPGITPALVVGVSPGGPPLGVDANTKSLMKFDNTIGVGGGNALYDYAKPSRVWVGNSPLTTNGRYGGTSMDNNGSAISSPASDTDFDITGDFTIDFWCQPEGVAAGNSGVIVGKCNTASFAPWMFYQNAGGMLFYSSTNGTAWDLSGGQSLGAMTAGVWAHYAVTRQGNTWRTWRNGVQQATWTTALVPWLNTLAVNFGLFPQPGGQWGGFVDEWRFSNVARYSAAFTPQSTPYFPSLNGRNDAATRLLLHAEDFIDNALGPARGAPHVFTVNGTAVVSSAVAKFGSKSLRFDGSNNCLIQTPFNTALDLQPRDADWTVDFWYYRAGAPPSGYAGVIGTRSNNTQLASWFISDNTAGNFSLYGSSDGSTWNAFNNSNIGTVPSNQWVHCALVHDNSLPDVSALRFYINGAQASAYNWTKGVILYPMSNAFAIGGWTDWGGCNCYMDEIRYSAVARWNAAFTPPTAPY